MKVAIVHDQLTQTGGAERVALALHRMFPEAPVYTSIYDAARTYPAFRDADVRPSFLQKLPAAGGSFRAYMPLFPAAFGGMKLRGYDLVISSSSGWSHGVKAGDARHICYWHTPARWIYRTDTYLTDGGPVPRWGRLPARAAIGALRRWDRSAAARPDEHIVNSQAVAWRLRREYGYNATVINPPVDVDRFPRPVSNAGGDEPFYLVVARLLPYKRVDLAVKACEARGARIVVVGDGPARATVEAAAGPNTTLLGGVSETELLQLYARCRALLQCGEEDFGIAPLEANAAGRPVVAYGAGGAVETVNDGETGVLFRSQTADAVAEALGRIEEQEWDPAALRRHAERFSERAFAERLHAVIGGEVAGNGQSRVMA